MYRLHPWHWRKPDMQGFTVTLIARMQRSWSVKDARTHKAWPDEDGSQQETADGPPWEKEGSQNL